MNDLSEVRENPDKTKPLTVKEMYQSSKGRPISIDYFMFATFEESQTIKSLKDAYKEQLIRQRWEAIRPYLQNLTFLEEGAEKPCSELVESKELLELIPMLCQWYKENKPSLADSSPLDYEVYGNISQIFVHLIEDFTILILVKKGAPLAPKKDNNDQEIWDLLEKEVNSHFPTYAHYILSYVDWLHRKATVEPVDLKSLPPVGRYVLLLQRAFRNSSSSSSRANKDEKDSHKPHHQGDRKAFLVDKKDPGSPKKDNVKFEKEALHEAQKIIDQLKENTQLNSLELTPKNSYLRRLQHQLIVDAGFESESIGEAADRRVLAKRK